MESKILQQKTKKEEKINKNETVSKYLSHLKFIAISISFGFLISIVFLLFIYGIKILSFFSYFEKFSVVLREFLTSLLSPQPKNLTILFMIIVGYLSLLNYINKKKIFVFSEDKLSPEKRYFESLFFSYGLFNFILLLPFVIYLIWIKQAVIEWALIIMFYVLSVIFVSSMKLWGEIIYDYSKREAFRNILIEKHLESNLFLVFSEIFLGVRKPKEIISRFVNAFLSLFTILSIKKEELQKTIAISIPLFLWIFLYLEFNILSIIYMILSLLFWYFIVSCLAYMPLGKVNIYLRNGKSYKKVYIIEENPKGWIFIVDKNNKIRKIRAENILEIEENVE